MLKEKFVNGIDPPTKPILTSSETRHETVILSPEFAEAGDVIWSITGAAVSGTNAVIEIFTELSVFLPVPS